MIVSIVNHVHMTIPKAHPAKAVCSGAGSLVPALGLRIEHPAQLLQCCCRTVLLSRPLCELLTTFRDCIRGPTPTLSLSQEMR